MSLAGAPSRAPYGREAKYAPVRAAEAPVTTYYDQPQLKKSHWGVRVALYIFIAGLSGGAQLIATAADLAGGQQDRGTVRRGRHIALLAVVFGPPLLIWDLHSPDRFYNMLRIFRRTSPMSIGTYVLSSFSLFSLATAMAQLFGWTKVARITQLPAAVAGAGMTDLHCGVARRHQHALMGGGAARARDPICGFFDRCRRGGLANRGLHRRRRRRGVVARGSGVGRGCDRA